MVIPTGHTVIHAPAGRENSFAVLQGMKNIPACFFMTMDPVKHEHEAIFRRKMSGM